MAAAAMPEGPRCLSFLLIEPGRRHPDVTIDGPEPMRTAFRPYEPLNALKPFARDVWIVDGPEIGMHVCGVDLPFPTRMTVVRLPDGRLWVHSPVEPEEGLLEDVASLGPVGFLIAPNTLHYWWVMDWKARFPDAEVWAAPGLEKSAKRRLSIDRVLADGTTSGWDESIDRIVVEDGVLTEVVFFHRPSRTLVLTDLIENFEPARIRSPFLRMLIRLSGAADPDGKAPFDMRLAFLGHRRGLREAVRRMIDWAPERIVLAHGRCYEANGIAELKRAFRWVLPPG